MNFLQNYIDQDTKSEFNTALLWDFGEKEFDLQENKKIIIQRVVEYGSLSDWSFIIKQYGEAEIIRNIKEMSGLSKLNVNFVFKVFNLKPHELKCYTKPQWRKQHWT